MADAIVKGDFTVSADKLWELVRDFGNVSWIQGVTKVELEGEGPGMFRVFHVGDGPAVRERLAAYVLPPIQLGAPGVQL